MRSVADQKKLCASRWWTSEACNTAPCVVFAWVVGGWGECDALCGGGQTTRTVECVSGETGAAVDPSNCPSEAPRAAEECNTDACDFCMGAPLGSRQEHTFPP